MSQEGVRVENTFRVTLTDTVTRGHFVQIDGTEGGSTERCLGVALEDGISGQKIAVQISGIASVIVGTAATAGLACMCDTGGVATNNSGGVIMGQFLQTGTTGQSVQVNLWAA